MSLTFGLSRPYPPRIRHILFKEGNEHGLSNSYNGLLSSIVQSNLSRKSSKFNSSLTYCSLSCHVIDRGINHIVCQFYFCQFHLRAPYFRSSSQSFLNFQMFAHRNGLLFQYHSITISYFIEKQVKMRLSSILLLAASATAQYNNCANSARCDYQVSWVNASNNQSRDFSVQAVCSSAKNVLEITKI